MLGVVTADDVLEVLSDEADEDLERFAGGGETGPGHGFAAVFRARLPWALATFVVELAIAVVLLRPLPERSLRILLAFLPLLLLTGGSSALASAGVMLRRMRTQTGAVRLLAREVQGALLLAVIGAAATLLLLRLTGQPARLATVVSTSVGATVFVSSAMGAAAPAIFRALRRDPALASGPLLGGLADAASLAVYLASAKALL